MVKLNQRVVRLETTQPRQKDDLMSPALKRLIETITGRPFASLDQDQATGLAPETLEKIKFITTHKENMK
jgi:hypothetical protein